MKKDSVSEEEYFLCPHNSKHKVYPRTFEALEGHIESCPDKAPQAHQADLEAEIERLIEINNRLKRERTQWAVSNKKIHQETRALAERVVALEAENKRLREGMERIKGMGLVEMLEESFTLADTALSHPTPTTGILELAAAGVEHYKNSSCIIKCQLCHQYEALPQESKDILERILG
ncbi:MAG: hypothetical protein K0Q50_229 [Vampirovibrio sp.]|jgi:hypothetical protein|nr:hypothetical protein [Vampirovibrio sp.]